MIRNSRALAALAGAALSFSFAGAAHAQQIPASNGGGLDTHLFRPAMDSKGLFTTNGSDILGANDALLASIGHLCATEAGKAGLGQSRAQMGDDAGSIVVARGLAGGEKDARIGDGGDGYEFIAVVQRCASGVR